MISPKRLTIRDERDRIQQIGLIGGNLYNLVYEWGGEIYNKDFTKCLLTTPEVKEAYSFWEKFIDSGATHRIGEEGSMSFVDEFKTGRVAMMVTGTWSITGLVRAMNGRRWDIALIPKQKRRVSQLWINTFTISPGSKKKKEAFKFLTFLTSKEMQNYFLGNKTLEEATMTAKKRVDRILEQIQTP